MLYARLMSLAMLGFVGSAVAQSKLGVSIATYAVGVIIGAGALHVVWVVYLQREYVKSLLQGSGKLLVYVPMSVWAFLIYGAIWGWDVALKLTAVAMVAGYFGRETK